MRSEQWIESALDSLRSEQLERSPHVFGDEADVPAGVSQLLNFSSNDYLNLSAHPEVVGAAQQISRSGAGASRCHARHRLYLDRCPSGTRLP